MTVANTPPGSSTSGARIIAISSGKGGAGKSSLCLNLAVALSAQGQRVCVFDADTNLANINIMAGIQPTLTLFDYLQGNATSEDLLFDGPGGVSIVPAASGLVDLVNHDRAQQDRLIKLLQTLEQNHDFLFIDTAAGITESNIAFIQAAPELLLILTTEPTSLTDAFSLLKVLVHGGYSQPVKVVINRADEFDDARDAVTRFGAAVKKYLDLKLTCTGYVLEDRFVSRSIKQQHPYTLAYPGCIASRCINNYAERLKKASSQTTKSLTDYFEPADKPVTEEPQHSAQTENHDWLQNVVDVIPQSPFDEARLLMANLLQHWDKRIEDDNQQVLEHRRQGFRSAVDFAARR